MDNGKIVENIRLLCDKHGISVSQLERSLFMSQGLISRWTKNMPTLDRIMDIAAFFSVPIEAIVGDASKSEESNRKNVNRLLSILYDKSINAEIEWDVLDPTNLPLDLQDNTMSHIVTSKQQDVFYSSVNEGYFFLVIDYTSSEETKLFLYVLPTLYSFPELCCSDTQKLNSLYTYLSRRLQKKLNSIKTDNFINDFIDTYSASISAENDKKITLISRNSNAVNQ